MSDGFSDKPLTVRGITTKPKWKWSDSYRDEQRASQNAGFQRDSDAEHEYVKWYAEKHGISVDEARRRVLGNPDYRD